MTNRYVLMRGLIRGNGHWGRFPDILKKMDPGCEIEMFEIPGNGTRHNEKSPTSPLQIIADFRDKSSFVKENRSFVICGISLGGMLALKWLESYPDDIQKTFVINPSLSQLSPFYHRLRPHNYLTIIALLLSDDSYVNEKKILQMTTNHPLLDNQLQSHLINYAKRFPVKKINFIRQLILAQRIRVSENLRQPITIIMSEKDHLVNAICSEKLAHYLKAQVIAHPTAGHDLPLDDPEWLAQILSKN